MCFALDWEPLERDEVFHENTPLFTVENNTHILTGISIYPITTFRVSFFAVFKIIKSIVEFKRHSPVQRFQACSPFLESYLPFFTRLCLTKLLYLT